MNSGENNVVHLEFGKQTDAPSPLDKEPNEATPGPVRLSEKLRGSIDEGLKKQMRDQMRKKHGL